MDGIDALSHAELLSILLGSGVKGHPVKAISEDLILHHGSLNQMACADIPQLCQTRGIGVDKAMIIKAAFALAKRLVGRDHQSGGSWSVQSKWLNIYGSACVLRRWSVFM